MTPTIGGFSTIPNLALRLGTAVTTACKHLYGNVFNYSEFSPSVRGPDSIERAFLRFRFSTIPNLALRLGAPNWCRSSQHVIWFSTIPNLALRLGITSIIDVDYVVTSFQLFRI